MSTWLPRLWTPVHRPTEPAPGGPVASSRRVRSNRVVAAALIGCAMLLGTGPLLPDESPLAPASADAASGLIFTRAQIRNRPTSGAAWKALKAVADSSIGTPKLADINDDHSIKALAAALVFARTGKATYRSKARKAIMASIGTENSSTSNALLGVARNLGSIVVAADLIKLRKHYPKNDKRFRTWLSAMRTKRIGTHGRWTTLVFTHRDSASNWGAFAGASRIAASRYLGDSADVAKAARILKGFLGNRNAYSSFRRPDSTAMSWSCNTASTWRPLNRPCTKGGHNLSGAIIEDISREGSFSWPPTGSAVTYMQESLQGLLMQAELLQRAGYSPYRWSDRALRRAARFVSSYSGWNPSTPGYHVPWILNARYGLSLPTKSARYGRMFGFTDWLYGRSGLKVA